MGTEEKRFFEKTVRAGMHVVDIGANLGIFTLLFSHLVGESGTVTALEPDPELFEALKMNCSVNAATNVRLYNLAAGARSDAKVLYRSLINAGDNRLAGGRSSGLRRAMDVRVATLDEITAGENIDFIKIDVQGWESEVFGGMKQVLAGNPALQIHFEYWPSGLRAAGSDPVELLANLGRLGFQICQASDQRLLPITDFTNVRVSGGYADTNLYAYRAAASSPARQRVDRPNE